MSRTMNRKIRVAIIFGGRSAEHEVSLQSARNVIASLDTETYEPVLIGIDRTGRWFLNQQSMHLLNENDPRLIALNHDGPEVALTPNGEASSLVSVSGATLPDVGGIDVIFPVLHGPYGEDGTIQGLAKLANVPCVGPGVLGSAVSMDKDVMKRLFRDAGIPIADFLVFRSGRVPERAAADVENRLGYPVFVKPANLGSSVGISRVPSAEQLAPALDHAFEYDTKAVVEEAVIGREIEVSVLGNEEPIASLPGEVVTSHNFYSYEAKYVDEHGARLDIPAQLSEAETAACRALAVRAYEALCCTGMSRVDMFLRSDGTFLVNEINTIPGFTRISMYPKLWEATGVNQRQLVNRLIRLAIDEFSRAQSLKTTPD